MMKKALWRGGRLIAVMALASAFLGSTAGAGELAPAPTVQLEGCKNVAVVRDAKNTSKLTVSGKTQTATATVHGDATVRVCWKLQATAGAAVSVVVESEGKAQATAEAIAAIAAGVDVRDSEEVCVNARASLVAAAGTRATATGWVTAAVVANTSASADANTIHADAQGNAAILLTASVDVAAGSPTRIDQGELAALEHCTETLGSIGIG